MDAGFEEAIKKLAKACAAADIARGDGECNAGVAGAQFLVEATKLAAARRTKGIPDSRNDPLRPHPR